VLPLTLDEAIERALATNPDYLVELLRARQAQEGVQQALAAFDPALSVEAAWTEARPPFFTRNPFAGLPPGLIVASSEQLGVTTALTQRFITGTQVRAFWTESRQKTENQFSLNPSYQPSYGVEITQPLLRGFGIDANMAPIHVAQANALQADATYADVLMQAVLTVEESYWGLVRAEEELKFQERSLESALKFLDDTRRRREVGAAADLDVIIAQAGVATRREGVIQAENALEATRDQLLRLVQPSGAPGAWDVLLVPTDRPWLLAEPDLEVNKAVETARRRRPDVATALLTIEAAEYLKVQRDNEVLPQVDLFSSLREDGLGGQHHAAWTAAASGRFYTWQVGLRLGLPLLLRAERSRARAAQLDLDRAHVQLKSLEATVVLDVRRTVRDVRTAKATIEATRASRILAARRLRATRTQVEHGTAVPRDVLDDLAQLAQAEGNEVRAFINYRLSISRHERAKGTLLDRWVDKLDPRVRRSLDRQAFAEQ
jgi:outer membrane protein TolC